jgi:peptidoglycan/LPS O-acetylase OafA/YrhL
MTSRPRQDRRLRQVKGAAAPQSSVQKTGGRIFFGRVESLRGMAALCVAVFHSFVWMPVDGQPVSIRAISDVHGPQAIIARILIAFVHGTSWVGVFFILSGFVLANSLEGRPLLSIGTWVRFVVRRGFRIMPPLIASLLFIAAILAIRSEFHLFPRSHDWYGGWTRGPTWQGFWANAGLIRFGMNPPSWTLRVEAIAALAFPLLLAICRRLNLLANILFWALVALAWSAFHFPLLAPLLLFVIGINGYLSGAKLLGRAPDWALPILGLCSLALIVVPNLWLVDFRLPQTLCAGFGGVGLVVLLSSDRTSYGTAWLNSATARFMGRISFSFYLLHYIVLYITTLSITGWASPFLSEHASALLMLVSAVISIAISAALAWGMFVWVERPSNWLGRRLTRKEDVPRQSGNSVAELNLPDCAA